MGERRRREPRPRIERVYAESRLRTAGDDMPAHHWHPYYEMFYVETGACSYMVENEIYDLHMGDFLLIPPHTFHYTRYRFGPCRRAAVFFRVPAARRSDFVCAPCGRAFQRSVLPDRGILGIAKLRRVQWTKQPKRSRGSGLLFASGLLPAQQKQGTATKRISVARLRAEMGSP